MILLTFVFRGSQGRCSCGHSTTSPHRWTFVPKDIAIAFGFAPPPPGPWTTAEGLAPFTLLPGQAVDLTLFWAWVGEPYAMLRFGVYRYAVQLE